MTNEAQRNEDAVDPLVRLAEHDRIVCAYARKASGPGWANRPVWVVVEDRRTGKMREECIQPAHQSEELWRLYDIAHEVDCVLYAAVKRLLANAPRQVSTRSGDNLDAEVGNSQEDKR